MARKDFFTSFLAPVLAVLGIGAATPRAAAVPVFAADRAAILETRMALLAKQFPERFQEPT